MENLGIEEGRIMNSMCRSLQHYLLCAVSVWSVVNVQQAAGTETQLTGGAIDHFNPIWSPDGSLIVYEHTHPVTGNHQLCTVDPDAADPNDPNNESPLVVQQNLDHFHPRWSPVVDNDPNSNMYWVAYERETAAGSNIFEIYVVSEDGQVKYQRSLDPDTDTGGTPLRSHRFPRWSSASSNGKFLIFERQLVGAPTSVSAFQGYSSITFGSDAADLPPDIWLNTAEKCDGASLNCVGNKGVSRPVFSLSNMVSFEREKDEIGGKKIQTLDYSILDLEQARFNPRYELK